MLAQSTVQYFFVLPSLHKIFPSNASYYKACAKCFPVLLRTTQLAQSNSQYYFVVQSLNKVLPGKENHHCQNEQNLLPKHRSQLSCSHYSAIYDPQMQNRRVLRLQLQLLGTLTQPCHCHLQTLSCQTLELHTTAPQIAAICSSKIGSRRQSGKTTILKHFSKRILKGKASMPK